MLSEAKHLSPTAKHLGPIYAGLAVLSAAALAFEITLTRLFSVTQWYHFAFLAVSVALLGYGASGTALSLAPRWAVPPAGRPAGCCGKAAAQKARLPCPRGVSSAWRAPA